MISGYLAYFNDLLRRRPLITALSLIVIIVILLPLGWWGVMREPCWRSLKMGETHWGGTAFGAGLGDCVGKPWWRP